MNPLTLIDSILEDWASPRVRRLIHGLLLLAATLAGLWLAADGDWIEALGALVAAMYVGSNHANTHDSPQEPEDSGDPDHFNYPGY